MCSVTVSARLGKGCPLVRSPARLGISRHVQRRTRRAVAAAIDETDRLTTAEEQLKAEASRPVGKFLDENAILAKSSFPIPPAELIARAKDLLAKNEPDFLADPNDVDVESFAFKAPFVGPLSYAEMRKALKGFDLSGAFELIPCHHNFWVDPYEPSRVWYTSRPYGRHIGPVMGKPPTYKVIDQTPSTNSFVFNEEGKVVKVTIGYPMDRDLGNSGGMSAVFGLLYAVGQGLPFPEARPYEPSLQFKAKQLHRLPLLTNSSTML